MYQGTSKIAATVSVHCEACGHKYDYEHTLRGAAQRPSGSAAIDAAQQKLADKVKKLEMGDYGAIAAHKPCPCCGYVQSWMIVPVRRRRGWQWGLGLAIASYLLAFSTLPLLQVLGNSDWLVGFNFCGMPILAFFVVRTIAMMLYRPNRNREIPSQTNTPSIVFHYPGQPFASQAAASARPDIPSQPAMSAQPDSPGLPVGLASTDGRQRSQAIETAVAAGPTIVSALLQALSHPDDRLRAGAANALGRLAPVLEEPAVRTSAVTSLITALGDAQPAVRKDAAYALDGFGDARAFDALLDSIDDPDATVRGAAAIALGGLGDPRAIEPMAAQLAASTDEDRVSLAAGLGRLRDERGFRILRNLMHDSSLVQRSLAALSLAMTADERAVAPLVGGLRDSERTVRLFCAGALGEFDSPLAHQALCALQNHGDADLRQIVLHSLDKMRQRQPTGTGTIQSIDASHAATTPDKTPGGPAAQNTPPTATRALKRSGAREKPSGATSASQMCPHCNTPTHFEEEENKKFEVCDECGWSRVADQ